MAWKILKHAGRCLPRLLFSVVMVVVYMVLLGMSILYIVWWWPSYGALSIQLPHLDPCTTSALWVGEGLQRQHAIEDVDRHLAHDTQVTPSQRTYRIQQRAMMSQYGRMIMSNRSPSRVCRYPK